MLNLYQIAFCAAECQRQRSGEMSVYNMCAALDMLMIGDDGRWFNHHGIQTLGLMIEPHKNAGGYRKTPVMIDDQTISADNIQRQMDNWLSMLDGNVEPADMYQEFESIHPFIDGNGRVGALLYNYLRDSLDDPVAPPEISGEG